MLPVTLYNFPKRQNSTAVPSSGGTPVEVVLKQETSYNNPSFVLQTDTAPEANYLAFDGAYYFIDDIRSVRANIWELVCSIDPLGTLRSDILNSSAFVEYATGGDAQIVDPRIEVEYGVGGVNVETAAVFPGGLISGGSKYITVLGQTNADTYYIADANLQNLFASISNWSEGVIDRTSLETILDTGLRQLVGSGSAASCVRDAYMLPCGPIPETLGGAGPIYLGMFNTGVNGNKLTGSGVATKITNIAIPHQYADWRKQAPYEVVQLYLPLYGDLNIPSDIAADNSALTVESRLNVRSGDFTYYVSGANRNGKEITVGGNCAAPLAVGSSNINVAGSMGNIAAGLAAASYGNMPGAAAASLRILSPVPQSVGATGGISNTYPNAQCLVYWRNTSEAPGASAATHGIPLGATRRIGTLSGYVQTRGASIGGSGRSVLKEAANSLLDSGVFVE